MRKALKQNHAKNTKQRSHTTGVSKGNLASGPSLCSDSEQGKWQEQPQNFGVLERPSTCSSEYDADTESDNNVIWKGSLKVVEQKLWMPHPCKCLKSGWTGL